MNDKGVCRTASATPGLFKIPKPLNPQTYQTCQRNNCGPQASKALLKGTKAVFS